MPVISEQNMPKMREASRIVALVHKELKEMIKPGVTLKELDQKAYDIIIENDATPSFLGYGGFEGSICSSVNEVMVHGIPTNLELKEGDIISVDVGVTYQGFNGDAAFTMGVGKISERDELLLKASKEALAAGIAAVKDGATTGDIGYAVEQVVKSYGFNVPADYTGHGIGENLHEDPYVPNYGKQGEGTKLVAGQVICIEPMLIDGADDLFTDPLDQWTVRTKHGGRTAHDEHTVLVTENEGEILTKL